MHGRNGKRGSRRERACSDSCVLGMDNFGASTQNGLIRDGSPLLTSVYPQTVYHLRPSSTRS